MNSYLIGIDAGTTSMKGILVDDQGKMHASACKEYQLDTPANDICELDPEIYWKNAVQIIKDLIVTNSTDPASIRGLAISSQGETLICVNRDGNPVRKAIVDRKSVV